MSSIWGCWIFFNESFYTFIDEPDVHSHTSQDKQTKILLLNFYTKRHQTIIAFIIIIIIIMSCRQHGYPWPSLATSPYRSSHLAGLQGYIPYPHIAAVCMYVRACRPAFARPYVGVHWSTSLMSSSLLLQQCPACMVRLTWIVFVMGGWWPYSWCFVGCCRQDLFNKRCYISISSHKVNWSSR